LSRWHPDSDEALAIVREMARVSGRVVTIAVNDADIPSQAEKTRVSGEHPYASRELTGLLYRAGVHQGWASEFISLGQVVAIGVVSREAKRLEGEPEEEQGDDNEV